MSKTLRLSDRRAEILDMLRHGFGPSEISRMLAIPQHVLFPYLRDDPEAQAAIREAEETALRNLMKCFLSREPVMTPGRVITLLCLIAAVIIIVMCSTSCRDNSAPAAAAPAPPAAPGKYSPMNKPQVWTDPETGCEYLVLETAMNNYPPSICPRFEKDGKTVRVRPLEK